MSFENDPDGAFSLSLAETPCHSALLTQMVQFLDIKPCSENIALFKRKFDTDRIVRFLRVLTQKICEIVRVIKKRMNENSACQLKYRVKL